MNEKTDKPAEPTPEPEKKKETIHDRLQRVLYSRLGSDRWNQTLRLHVPADALSWIVLLACEGLAARQKKFRETPRGKQDMGELCSLASFESDLVALVDAAEKAPVVNVRKGGKK